MKDVTRSCVFAVGLASLACTASAAPYTFLAGYNVLDEANSPGIGTNFAATTGLKYGNFGADVAGGIVYLSREFTSTADGRTNTTSGPLAVFTVTNGFNGANYTDTGLLQAETNSQPIQGSHGPTVIDAAKNRLLVLGDGTNSFDFRGVIYASARGTLGGAPAGGNPGAARPALTNLFQVPNDLTNLTGSSTRAGVPLGMAARTTGGVTTVYLALGNHVEAWRDDATNGSPQFPWRRLWASFRGPRQNTVDNRLASSDRVINGIAVDDQGNCYFTVQFTEPARIWRVPANAAQLAPEPTNLDFDDRALGGSNSGPNVLITPVIPRLPSPAMLFSGTNSFVNPQNVTFFRTDGRAGLFVSSLFWMNGANKPFTPYRAIARLLLDPPTLTTEGYPVQAAALVDAFGTSASPSGQDTILQTLQSSRSAGMSPSFGDTQPMKLLVGERLPTQVNAVTNPTTLYFQAFVTDTNKGQTIPTAAIGLATIPAVPFAPAITSVLPTSGSQYGGTIVSINGSNFVSGATVSFGGVPSSTVNFSNSTLLVATSPSNSPGVVTITVQNPDGQIGARSNSFTYLAPPPQVTGISPTSGSTAGGTFVAITGTNFVNGATVRFANVNATSVNFSNSTLITAVTPARSAGSVNVRVQNPDGQADTLGNGYTYLVLPPPPAIVSVTPTNGPATGGTFVTITGSNFVIGLSVKFGGSNATSVNFSNSTLITAVTPAHAAGPVHVAVQTPDLQTGFAFNAFTFVATSPPPPAIVSITPTNGPTTGGTLVAITGSNFVSGLSVLFGTSNAASVNFSNSTLITAVTPAHVAGTVHLIAQNPDLQSSTLSNAFTFLEPPLPPAIVGITPTNGPDSGGTFVEITGSNFVNGLTVFFGESNAVSVNFSNSTLVTAETPAHSAGAVDVTVRNPDLQTATATNAFTFTTFLGNFSITSVSLLDEDSVKLVWQANPSSIYAVESRNDLLATNWTMLGLVTAASSSASFTNSGVNTNLQRFYRVGRLP
jgi:hypothetical protein